MNAPLQRRLSTVTHPAHRFGACLGILLCVAAPAWAQAPSPAPSTAATQPAEPSRLADSEEALAPPGPRPIGADTRALFERQRQASAQRSPLGIPGPVAVETWERYLRSYKSEIPTQFDRQLKESVNR